VKDKPRGFDSSACSNVKGSGGGRGRRGSFFREKAEGRNHRGLEGCTTLQGLGRDKWVRKELVECGWGKYVVPLIDKTERKTQRREGRIYKCGRGILRCQQRSKNEEEREKETHLSALN